MNLAPEAPHDIPFRGIGADFEYVEVPIFHFDSRCCRLLTVKLLMEIQGELCGLSFVWPVFALALRLVCPHGVPCGLGSMWGAEAFSVGTDLGSTVDTHTHPAAGGLVTFVLVLILPVILL